MGGLLSRGQVDSISINSSQRSGGDDHFSSVEQVTEAIEKIGLESCNLMVALDFTKSNEWTGEISFGGRCLHDISCPPNPYQQALGIINRKLSRFDEDGEIPFFGFGDASTHDHDVFSFYPDNRPCKGISEGLRRYGEIVQELQLSGPTSFAPIIEMAVDTVKRSGYYHVLLIIADGQITGAKDSSDCLSFQEQRTVETIVDASYFPLSIILVGVGDGPWNQMEQFVSSLPPRCFDNFEFVNFTDIMSMHAPGPTKEARFALEVLRAIHSQYKATTKLQPEYRLYT